MGLVIYVKDVDGVFTSDDPAGAGAELIPRAGEAAELLAMDVATLTIDASCAS